MRIFNILAGLLCLLFNAQSNAFYSYPLIDSKVLSPPKIIALSPHIVELLFELGAGDQIIGTTDYADYPTKALDIERVGNAVSLKLEKIVAMQPDLIIAWKSGNPSQDLDKLKRLGFKVVYSQPNTFRELAEEIEYFGEITGHKSQGILLSKTLLSKLATLEYQYKNKQPVSVFYEVWHQPLTTVAQNAWPQHQLSICNATNPFANAPLDYPQISAEALMGKNIQAIIQPKSKSTANAEFFNWSRYKDIKAVRNNLFIHPNADAMHRMTLRSLDEVARLCAKLDQIRSFYHTSD